MNIFQNVTKGSLVKGSALLIVLAGAVGAHLTKWDMFGFSTGVPVWCFVVLASVGGVLFFLGPMVFGSASVKPVRQSSEKPERMLFLYLRPFELDARNILQLAVGASTGILVFVGLMKGLWWPKRLGEAPYLIFDTSWNPCFIREANRPTELARQIFSRSGDITRDRLRPVLKALNIELPS